MFFRLKDRNLVGSTLFVRQNDDKAWYCNRPYALEKVLKAEMCYNVPLMHHDAEAYALAHGQEDEPETHGLATVSTQESPSHETRQ